MMVSIFICYIGTVWRPLYFIVMDVYVGIYLFIYLLQWARLNVLLIYYDETAWRRLFIYYNGILWGPVLLCCNGTGCKYYVFIIMGTDRGLNLFIIMRQYEGYVWFITVEEDGEIFLYRR